MRKDRPLFRSYSCTQKHHDRCRRRYRATVGSIPRICGCQCHDTPPPGRTDTIDWMDAPPDLPRRPVALPNQR